MTEDKEEKSRVFLLDHFVKVIVNFDWMVNGKFKDIELVGLKVIPRLGEWFCVEPFLRLVESEKDMEQFEESCGSRGVLYVRRVWHQFKDSQQTVFIELALTDDDKGFYDQHFHDPK